MKWHKSDYVFGALLGVIYLIGLIRPETLKEYEIIGAPVICIWGVSILLRYSDKSAQGGREP